VSRGTKEETMMSDNIVSLDRERERVRDYVKAFWFRYGCNARKMFYHRGLDWAISAVAAEYHGYVREGWEVEHERQLRIN
jgi:hypothetical protein